MKEKTRGIIGGFPNPSKPDQDLFLLVKDVPKSGSIPGLGLSFKAGDGLNERHIILEGAPTNIYKVRMGEPHRFYSERLVHRGRIIVDIHKKGAVIRVGSGEV